MGKIKVLMETLLGKANGVASLDANGNVPQEQLCNAVNKAGDTMTGALIVSDNPNGHQAAIFNLEEYTIISSLTPDTSEWSQLNINSNFDAGLVNSLVFQRSDGSWYPVFHTGNKPSGSYTGNGDATPRTIEIGGLNASGGVLINSSDGTMAIVTPHGAIYKDYTTVAGLAYAECSFGGGVLRISSTHAALNASGVAYHYEVL